MNNECIKSKAGRYWCLASSPRYLETRKICDIKNCFNVFRLIFFPNCQKSIKKLSKIILKRSKTFFQNHRFFYKFKIQNFTKSIQSVLTLFFWQFLTMILKILSISIKNCSKNQNLSKTFNIFKNKKTIRNKTPPWKTRWAPSHHRDTPIPTSPTFSFLFTFYHFLSLKYLICHTNSQN